MANWEIVNESMKQNKKQYVKDKMKTLTNSSNFRRIMYCNKWICRQRNKIFAIISRIGVVDDRWDVLGSISNRIARMIYPNLIFNSNSFRRRFLVTYIHFSFWIFSIKDIGLIIGIFVLQLLLQLLSLQLFFVNSIIAFGSLNTYLVHFLNCSLCRIQCWHIPLRRLPVLKNNLTSQMNSCNNK